MIGAGGLLPLSFAPFHLAPLALVSLGLGFHLLSKTKDVREAIFYGWLFGIGKYAVGASWIYVSIHEQGGASESLASILVGLFVAGMALFSAVFGALFGVLRGNHRLAEGVAFVCAWVAMEWLLTWFLTGFPWLFAGYGVMDTWLAGLAPLGGVLLLSAAAAASAVAGVYLVTRRGRVGAYSLVFVGLLWGGSFAAQSIQWVTLGEAKTAALVQGNIEQISKWQPENRLPILERYASLTQRHWGADLIVWPEAALTLFASQAQPWLEQWQRKGARTGSSLLLGLPDIQRDQPSGSEASPRFQNTAIVVGAGSGRYVKSRLVPFGEYVPLEGLLRGLIGFFNLPMSTSESGSEQQAAMTAGAIKIGTAICYEVAYPELVRRDAQQAGVLVTISNDAWFGGSIGPHQHLQIARMRALENARYLLRATNNGLTAVVDERGNVETSLPQFEPGVLTGQWRAASGQTPFTRWGATPWLVVTLIAGLTCLTHNFRRS